MCTARVWIPSTNSTYKRCSSTVSTCRKSQARMPDAWAVRNCRHVGDARRGAGPRPTACRIRRIVPSPTRHPKPSSSLCIRRYQQSSRCHDPVQPQSGRAATRPGRRARHGQPSPVRASDLPRQHRDHAEDLDQLEDVVQGGAPLALLDLADVAPVQARLLGELLLALPELVTARAPARRTRALPLRTAPWA
jgi:hypothetical protein